MDNKDENSTPICTVDPFEYLQIKRHPYGKITRLLQLPSTPPNSDLNSPSLVLTQDFPLNSDLKTYLRLFLPKIALSNPSKKLPIIVYFHGGGFVILHADIVFNHDFCSTTALNVSAIVVSVDYRLCPEHRLPAAYEDAVQALEWIRGSVLVAAQHPNLSDTADHWLSKYGDSNNCFLMGTSAGGNIAYQTALRLSTAMDNLYPLKIKGLILHHPFFGGLNRTESELRLINNPYLPLSGNELFWELCLPKGVGREHEYCNPLVSDGLSRIEKIKEMGLRVLVTDCDGDPLVDRLLEFVKVLEEKGVIVKGHFTPGDYHGVEILDHIKCEEFLVLVQSFVISCLNS